MKAPKFNYIKANSLRQTLELLDELGEEGRIIAGGQSLMPTLNMRLSQPNTLIDINGLQDLEGITLEGEIVKIGALTRHIDVAQSSIISEHLSLISKAMPHVAHVAVRNRGTIGGCIALADPAAEMPACALALGAIMVVESLKGRREIAAEDFFKGLYETERKPNELLVEILIPVERPEDISVFMELAQRHGDFAMAGIACLAQVKDKTFKNLKLVYFGSEDKPTLAKNTIASMLGKTWSEDCCKTVTESLNDDLNPMENLQGGSAMKLHLQNVLTGRVLRTALDQAETE